MRRTAVTGILAVSLILIARPGTSEDETLKGIDLSDMDRSADACTDFYDFANGAWRAANPIPPSMSRWSRRWAAGELSKDQLKGILEETVAIKDAPKGSVDQLTGDFYGACMDVAQIDKLGAKPIQPLLDRVAAMKNADDLQM